MKRREFIAFLGGAAAWPLGAEALPERVRRIGFMLGFPEQDPQTQRGIQAFHDGLKRVRLEEGRNVQIDFRWPGIDPDKTRAFARELIALKPDLIVAGTNQVVTILMEETQTIPIVFVFIGDPVGSRYAVSLNQPGRNLTGFANFEKPMGSKWLEVLKEVVPQTKRVGFVYHPAASPHVEFLHSAEASAPSLGLELTAIPVQSVADIERLIPNFANAGSHGALVVAPHALTLGRRELITDIVTRHKLPGGYGDRYFARSGGLLSHRINPPDQLRRAATYVNAILKGAKPGELPVQLPTQYEMIINLAAAKRLGVEISPLLLSQADEVIE